MALTHNSRRNIRTVFIKELRDVLRDRRTLFAAIILPVIINPLLFIGLFTLMSSQTAKQRSQDFTVAIGGAEHGPTITKIIANYEPPQAITQPVNIPAGKSLRPDDIIELPPEDPEKPETLHPVKLKDVASPESIAPGLDEEGFGQHLDDLLEAEAAANVRSEDNGIAIAFWRYDRNHDGQLDAAELWRLEAMKRLRLGEIDVAVILPENFERNLHSGVTSQRPEVLYLGSSDSSDTASGHIRRLLNGFVEPWTPMEMVSTDVKTGSKGIKEVSRFIPYIIILMVLMAAFTPAIDLMAGEKERGTIETLLISPSDRKEIITGKFLTVATIAIAAAALNLASLGFTVMYIGSQVTEIAQVQADAASRGPQLQPAGTQITEEARARIAAEAAANRGGNGNGNGTGGNGDEDGTQTAPITDQPRKPLTPPAGSVASPFPEIPFYLYPVILLLMIPAAGLFGAVALAISAFARSYREGQQYIGPVTLVAIPLSMISLLPGIDFNWQWGLVPISNFALLFRDIMTTISAGDPLSTLQWVYVAEVTIVTGIYAWLALRWATSIFYREDILFREAEEFNWRFWQKPGPPRLTPSGGSAVFAFVISLILFFFVGQSWQIGAMKMPEDQKIGAALRAHVMTQALLIALPCILLAALNKYDWKSVFRLDRLRPIAPLAGALMLMAGLGLVMMEIQQLIAKLYPDLGKSDGGIGELMLHLDPWVAILAMAVVPGICEEILFRGYVLSGMVPDKIKSGRTRRCDGAIPVPWKAIFATAVLFGVMHLAPIRIPLTAIGGIALCWIAWRTRSLVMPMISHIAYNGFIIGAAVFTETVTVADKEVVRSIGDRLIDSSTGHLHVIWIVVGVALLVGGCLLVIRLTRELQFEPWEPESRARTIERVSETGRRSNPAPALASADSTTPGGGDASSPEPEKPSDA